VTCSLKYPENERQWSVNSFSSCIFGIQSILQIFALITELLTSLFGKNPIHPWWNIDWILNDIANCKACKNVLLVVENPILISHYEQTAKTRALFESIDGPAGQPTDNLPNSYGLGVSRRTVPELTVQVNWRPGPPIWPLFGWDPDLDMKWRSGTVANTHCESRISVTSEVISTATSILYVRYGFLVLAKSASPIPVKPDPSLPAWSQQSQIIWEVRVSMSEWQNLACESCGS
jgi:hypothetical protein